MEAQVYEFRWKDEHSPYFRIIYGGGLTELPLTFGQQISIAPTSGVRCAGFEKDGRWSPCIAGGVEGTRKCEQCKAQEGYPAAQYCDGYNLDMFTAEELETLNCPHYLYLAMFDKGLVKIGVSSSHRGYLRQIEQGSHYSLIIADGMWGVPARQMESMIRKSGIQDKIQASQKKDIIFPEVHEEEARTELDRIAAEVIPTATAARPEFREFVKETPEFLSFDQYYKLAEAKNTGKPMHSEKLDPEESLSGNLVGIKGSFLLVETESELIALNGKQLKGHLVDFSPRPVGLNKKEGFQGALF